MAIENLHRAHLMGEDAITNSKEAQKKNTSIKIPTQVLGDNEWLISHIATYLPT